MNADTINAIMNMATVQSLNSQSLYNDSGSSSGMGFSSVLSSMLGTSTSDSALTDLPTGTTVDYNALLDSATGGLRIQDIQANAMTKALEELLGAEEPLVTDPVLAQLLEMMQNHSGGSEADVLALIEQMQARLKEMLEEDGAAMAGQQALALMTQLMPLFTGQATADSMAQSLNAAGGEAALELMLQKSPQELVSLMNGGTVQQNGAGVSSASAAGNSQPDLVQTAGDPQPMNAEDAGPLRVESVETGGASQPTLAQMLETGKAQGNFASAVRTVKEQMASSQSSGFQEELDADDLQRQVDASSVNQTVRTANVAPSPEQVRETPQPVPMQLQQAITKGIAAGEGQVVVKLNPQNLGEVTIEIQKLQSGAFVLNIIAKNPETQRLLAGEMAQLQQNLRPLNAEVESVTTEQQYTMASAQQQFGGQHQRSWKEMHGAAYFRDEPLSAQAEQEMAQPVLQEAPSSMLDTYI